MKMKMLRTEVPCSLLNVI